MLRRTLGRLLLIPLALVLSAFTALTVLSILVLRKLEITLDEISYSAADFYVFWHRTSFQHVGFPEAVGLLILLVVLLGELLHYRSVLYYILGFGASLGALSVFAPSIGFGDFYNGHESLWQIFTTAGFAAGFVYWAVAGRTA